VLLVQGKEYALLCFPRSTVRQALQFDPQLVRVRNLRHFWYSSPFNCGTAGLISIDDDSFSWRGNGFGGSDLTTACVGNEDSDSSPAGQPETYPAGLGARPKRKWSRGVRCSSSRTRRARHARNPAAKLRQTSDPGESCSCAGNGVWISVHGAEP